MYTVANDMSDIKHRKRELKFKKTLPYADGPPFRQINVILPAFLTNRTYELMSNKLNDIMCQDQPSSSSNFLVDSNSCLRYIIQKEKKVFICVY